MTEPEEDDTDVDWERVEAEFPCELTLSPRKDAT
jgi:hypothetical protein